MNSSRLTPTLALSLLLPSALLAQSLTPLAPFPIIGSSLSHESTALSISRPVQPVQPFTVAGPRGVLVGTQDGQFESWILPIKLLSHLTIEANIQGYSVPISVNQQAASIEVSPDHTTLTYSHIGFTLRQIMFSPDASTARVPPVPPLGPGNSPSTGPVCLFQIDADHPIDLVFRFTPEMRWMWPKRNDGIPGPDWVPFHPPASLSAEPNQLDGEGYYTLHMDYPDVAGAITIPTATPGIAAPYQERPQEHPLELHLHYDPTRDGRGEKAKLFPLLMAVATTREAADNKALGQVLANLNAQIPALYAAHAASWEKLQTESTSIETPDKALNEAFRWGVVSIEQLKTHEFASNQDALVAGYFASGDSARPGFGWFFGRDSLYTLYAINSYGDFALTRAELEFLIARQRDDGKIMHEYSQTAADPTVNWKQFPYMYAAADATPLFLMAMRDYYRTSGDLAFVQKNREAIERAWAFETAPTSDTDHDGIYDNSQGTGWVESWPQGQPHQEVYLALLDEQASAAFAGIEAALGDPQKASAASTRATKLHTLIETEYYDAQKGCYAFSHNLDGSMDKASTMYPSIAWWDYNKQAFSTNGGAPSLRSKGGNHDTPDTEASSSALDHPATCLAQWAGPTIATDWGLRDVATSESFYDGMSYHQGSVWPLFTGWGALAEYRANQPLPAQQMLMQNVDLTWAQDPGAVTELLSGDFYVPMGRSTSHQLWSSAMVLTPTLRGLFGINLDAATNTITVNPHLPANWDHAIVRHLHLGDQDLILSFKREQDRMLVTAIRESDFVHVPGFDLPVAKNDAKPLKIQYRSDVQGAQLARDPKGKIYGLRIPLPPVEAVLPRPELPAPGSRPAQLKILSTKYDKNQLTLSVTGPAGSSSTLLLAPDQLIRKLKLEQDSEKNGSASLNIAGPFHDPLMPKEPMKLDLHFPPGEGWQTLTLTLTW